VNIHFTGGMETLKMGETVLIPAAIASEITLYPKIESRLLEVYIEE
jgi:hypothetical protein